jgi:hypothetical protein
MSISGMSTPGRAGTTIDRPCGAWNCSSDGFAVVTLQRVGLNPRRLTSGLEKVGGYNRARFRVAVHENNYPSLSERRQLVERLVEWLGGSGSQ